MKPTRALRPLPWSHPVHQGVLNSTKTLLCEACLWIRDSWTLNGTEDTSLKPPPVDQGPGLCVVSGLLPGAVGCTTSRTLPRVRGLRTLHIPGDTSQGPPHPSVGSCSEPREALRSPACEGAQDPPGTQDPPGPPVPCPGAAPRIRGPGPREALGSPP